MPLRVWTARITYSGADKLDITRGKGRGLGLAFAPSHAILQPALSLRELSREATAAVSSDLGARVNDAMWAMYVGAFRAEMALSYRENRAAWDELLAMEERTLTCFCTTPQCHRVLVARMLEKCGATYMGERPPEPPRPRAKRVTSA